MMNRWIFLPAWFVLSAFPAFGATIHVPKDQPTIQAGIDAAADGDTILVAPGTYVENIHYNMKALTVVSEKGPEQTVIDGSQSGSVVTLIAWTGDAVLSGFTITNGTGDVYSNSCKGGGVFLPDNSASSPLITNNIIVGNKAHGSGLFCLGGGIYAEGGYPVILNNVITDNSVEGDYGAGGGIALSTCVPVVRNNVIARNSVKGVTTGKGGGIEYSNNIYGGVAPFGGNIIQDNYSSGGGGGCYFSNFTLADVWITLFDNIIAHNQSMGSGGGICAYDQLNVLSTNNTVVGNSAGKGGGFMTFISDLTVDNTILWSNTAATGKEIYFDTYSGNTLSVSHSNLEGGKASLYVDPAATLDWGPGMIDVDPLFVDAGAFDYHLTYTSLCRNSGDNSAPDLPLGDFEQDPRKAEWVTDMGADEFYRHLYYTGDATPGGTIQLKIVGIPGTSPVGLWFSAGYLDPPLPSQWGDWHLAFPVFGPIDLGVIPSPDGVCLLQGVLPAASPGPYQVHFQALVGTGLTNLCTLRVN